MFTSIEHNNLAPSDCIALFKLFTEWILTSDKPSLIRHGHEQLLLLGKRRPKAFKEFVNPNLLINVFTNTMHCNKSEMITLVGNILELLSIPDEDADGIECPNEDEKALQNVYVNNDNADEGAGALHPKREKEDLQRTIINVAR